MKHFTVLLTLAACLPPPAPKAKNARVHEDRSVAALPEPEPKPKPEEQKEPEPVIVHRVTCTDAAGKVFIETTDVGEPPRREAAEWRWRSRDLQHITTVSVPPYGCTYEAKLIQAAERPSDEEIWSK